MASGSMRGGSQNATRKPPRCSYWKWMESGKREESMCLNVDGKLENRENVFGSGWEAEREEIMRMDMNLV